MSEETYIKETRAKLGIEAKDFLNSNLGKYIKAKARRQVQDAQVEFQEGDPNDIVNVRRIHAKINIPIQAIKWIDEIINEGIDSEAQLMEEIEQAKHID